MSRMSRKDAPWSPGAEDASARDTVWPVGPEVESGAESRRPRFGKLEGGHPLPWPCPEDSGRNGTQPGGVPPQAWKVEPKGDSRSSARQSGSDRLGAEVGEDGVDSAVVRDATGGGELLEDVPDVCLDGGGVTQSRSAMPRSVSPSKTTHRRQT
jgi:hypothetical protein